MYSESVVQASIEKIEKASREEGRPLTLVRYERPQIEEMVEHLTGVFQQGSKRRPWTEEELAFIENEQIMCKVDFHYWAERYAHLIKDAGEGLGVIDLWESQKQLLLHISKLEEECVAAYERDEPVEGILIALNKARQLGATMICRMIIIHRLTLWDHSRSLSASVDEDKVLELYNRDKRILDNLPFYLVPAVSWSKHWKPDFGFDKKGEHMAFQAIDSSILYQHSKQQSGLGQGRQFDISHITEVASFPYPRMLEHDFFPTIPWSRWAFCVMESTPQGRGDWWHEWSEKVRHDRIPRWHYLFVPVYVERKKYRAQAPEDWSPSALTTQYARKVEETSPRVVGYQFHPDRNHLYWWETTRQAYAESNALTIFLTNYAATPEESFQFSTGAAIRPEVIQQLRMYESEPVSYEFTRS